MKTLQADTQQKVYAIDGKNFRRSGGVASKQKAIQMVSAWAVESGLVLA